VLENADGSAIFEMGNTKVVHDASRISKGIEDADNPLKFFPGPGFCLWAQRGGQTRGAA
jgi:hypothetical protein